MMDAALNRDPHALISKPSSNEEIDSYHVESTGATVTADSSVGLVYKYCEKLPRDKYDMSFSITMVTTFKLFFFSFFWSC